MRNKHRFKAVAKCRCQFDDCGKLFHKTITVEYVTNQRGDVIEARILD